jgi:D-beta-D-heptose 7-phosphate kinase/D-beta-D-heptose 1-phosphate adenosyltransferase
MQFRLASIMREMGRPRILVAGDIILDRYVFGSVSRISPEAPIQIVRVGSTEMRAGGAANVAGNLAALGADTCIAGTVGRDGPGRSLMKILRRNRIEGSAVVTDPSKDTMTKTRIIAHHQQMLRVDNEQVEDVSAEIEGRLISAMGRLIPSCNAVLLSDYGKGALTRKLLKSAIGLCRKLGKPVIIDPKGRDYSKYSGATAITPNQHEAELATGIEIRDEKSASRAATRLVKDLRLDFVVITRGEKGMLLLEKNGSSLSVSAEAKAVYDVTGAGDTVLAVLGLVIGSGHPVEYALRLANTAAGVKVGKLGTATVTRKEILSELDRHPHAPGKVVSLGALMRILESHRVRGEKIVFTNGCFDVIHAGHVRTLQVAKDRGDVLVVGLNSDSSVRKIKGPSRPINAARDRAAVLAALNTVDYVVVFDETTPEELIRRVRPNVLVKGQDWKGREVVGEKFLRSYGGVVELAPIMPGLSTTSMIGKMAAHSRGNR